MVPYLKNHLRYIMMIQITLQGYIIIWISFKLMTKNSVIITIAKLVVTLWTFYYFVNIGFCTST